VPAEVAFDYLADPANRPAWQSSLRRVVDVEPGPSRVGQRWTDVTWPGLRPRMRTTRHERPRRWAERGDWRGLASAWLELTFEEAGRGCVVRAELEVRAAGPVGRALTRLARPVVRADLARASRLLATRQ
jgi:hypothetical protein